MAPKLLLLPLLLFPLLLASALAQRSPQLSEEQQCRFDRISASRPSRQIRSEGGVTELWNERENQFQCAGVAPMRNTLRPNTLSLPNYHPTPRLVFIERGQGLISVVFPGCAETYHSQPAQQTTAESKGQRQDLHQKVHRIQQGDIIAIPAGALHWCHNDGNEELVAVSINDLNHRSNQLDQKFRAFYLAGGVPRDQQEQEQHTFQNIMQAFDTQVMADALNTSPEIVERIKSSDPQNERGLIVNVQARMSFIRPDEEQQQQQYGEQSDNGLEESFCSMKIRTNIENHRDTDIYSRQAGKVNIVDRFKLPILKDMDMSAERGRLFPNALFSPYWSMHGHKLVYVTRGEAQIQVVDNRGQAVMNQRVRQGDMFVVPQYYTSTAKAGEKGYEYVAFKTTGWPMRNPLAGYTSVMRGLPVEVLTNAYRMSPNQAQRVKLSRGGESYVLSSRSQPA